MSATFTDSVDEYVGLNYNQIREKNIQRNERILKEIFGLTSTSTAESPKCKEGIQVRKVAKRKGVDDGGIKSFSNIGLSECLLEEGERLKRVQEIECRVQSLSLRKEELNQILLYLDRNFRPPLSLIVCGSSGSGKTLCCLSCLGALPGLPSIIIKCKGFSNSKDLIRECFI
jgi:hypothetical protein